MIRQDARHFLGKIPFARRIARMIRRNDVRKIDIPDIEFGSSASYWEERYRRGGSSGAGAHGRVARFKAQVINQFVAQNEVTSVLEFGCGDGTQLARANYPRYVGTDVSHDAIELCKRRFSADPTKRFYHPSELQPADQTADLVMSLDVLCHLVDDDVYDRYMRTLVGAAQRFICVYSSNVDKPGHRVHVRHHCFTDWISRHAPQWPLITKIPNRFPEEETSRADFYFFAQRLTDWGEHD
jgi:SAM-dependent methyltransferase